MKLSDSFGTLFLVLFMALGFTARSQDNVLSVGANRSFFTTGDLRGWGIGFGYNHSVAKRIDIGVIFGASFATSNRINRASETGPRYAVISEGVENVFPDFLTKDAEYIDRGIASYAGNSEKLIYLTTDLIANYRLVNKERHIVKTGLGGSFAYAEESSTTLDFEGTFDGRPFFEEDVPIRMVVPAYARWIDLGLVVNLEYAYKISDRTTIGARGNWRILSQGDWIYSAGLIFGVNF